MFVTTALHTPPCTSLLSLIHTHNHTLLTPSTLPPQHTHIQIIPHPTHTQELQRRREEELSSLQEQLAELTAQLEALDLNMRKYTTGLQQMVEQQNQRETRNKEEEEAYRVKKRTFDLLPNAEDNIAKLQVHSPTPTSLQPCHIPPPFLFPVSPSSLLSPPLFLTLLPSLQFLSPFPSPFLSSSSFLPFFLLPLPSLSSPSLLSSSLFLSYLSLPPSPRLY